MVVDLHAHYPARMPSIVTRGPAVADVLMRQMAAVERRVARRHPGTVAIARSPAELDAVQAAG